jgi:hypothetical protein
MIITVGGGVVMVGAVRGIPDGIDRAAGFMSVRRVGGGARNGMVGQDVRCHLQPSGVVITVAANHRRSRERLHWQGQQKQNGSKTTDTITHPEKYSTFNIQVRLA